MTTPDPVPVPPPIALADLAAELGTTPIDLAARVTALIHQHGRTAVIHTPGTTNRRTLLQPGAADLLRSTAHDDPRPARA
ncbi:hypothetical protein [Kitasatospora sp. NPDC004272]